MIPEDLQQNDTRQRALSWVVGVLLVLGFAACLDTGADQPADPKPAVGGLDGFSQIAFRVVPQPNEIRCALLAATDEQRRQGLMEVTDLEGYPGMLFRFSQDSQAAFHMKNTPMPLSIAWFAADGSLVSTADMAPCPADQQDCPVYSASGPYRYALEVPQGGLPALGVVPGAKLEITGTC